MIIKGIDFSPDKIELAYQFTKNAYGDQKRHSGEPFISHPVAVAFKLATLGQSEDVVISGILHDVIEHTSIRIEEIYTVFGETVGDLVNGVTNIKNHRDRSIKKFILSVYHDPRVLLIKACDRLHNLQTLIHVVDEETRVRKAQETLDVLFPLLEFFGFQEISDELYDLCIFYIDPETYKILHQKIEAASKSKQLPEVISMLIRLTFVLKNVEVCARVKTFSSLWMKLKLKSKNIDNVFDIMGIRIIVENIKDCYFVQKKLFETFRVRDGSFKDYIKSPKSNGYQSLHCVFSILGLDHIELQIRTKEMHSISCLGIANHLHYKLSQKRSVHKNRFVEVIQKIFCSKEIVGSTLNKKLFCFTPNGAVVFLSDGGTGLDFAKKIHTNIFRHAAFMTVNGIKKEPSEKLCVGDEVFIHQSDLLFNRMENKRSVLQNYEQSFFEYLKASGIKRINSKIVDQILRIYGIHDRRSFWDRAVPYFIEMQKLYVVIKVISDKKACKFLIAKNLRQQWLVCYDYDLKRLKEHFSDYKKVKILAFQEI